MARHPQGKDNMTPPVRGGDELRVLVVDDDKYVAHLIRNMLLSADPNTQVEVAHSGFAAGQSVEKFEPHIIILDLIMPGMDGFQLCKTLKSDPATAGVRIIAITGDPNLAAASEIVSLGAEVCLAKPLGKQELFGVIGFDPGKDHSD